MIASFIVLISLLSVVSAGDRRATYSCDAEKEPITSVLIVSGPSAQTACPAHYSRIGSDLNQGVGGSFIFLCVTRGDAQNHFGVPLTDIALTAGPSAANRCPANFSRISQDLNEGAGGDFVYLCYERFGARAVTDLAVSAGACPAGFSALPVGLNAGLGAPLTLCVERACELCVHFPAQPAFRADHSFKLAQFTDAHYGEGYLQDQLAAANIYRATLLSEDPDLAVLTGDQVSGYAWDGSAGWFAEMYARVVDTFLALGQPYLFLLGNHDRQADLGPADIMRADLRLGGALSLSQLGPEDISGASNFVVSVLAADRQSVAYNFWVLDSGMDNCEGVTGWGCIMPDQVDWYVNTAASMLAASSAATLPPALGFFHIPIDQYLLVEDAAGDECSGRKGEDVCCSSVDTKVFDAFKAVGDITATFVGHDHDNDFGFTYENITMYYGRKSGYGGYGPPAGWQRGSRVSVLTEGVRGLTGQWVRNEDQSIYLPQQCARVAKQSQCCGMSGLVVEQDAQMDLSQFGEANGAKENKCALYEAAFRKSMTGSKPDLHARRERN